MNEKTEGSQFSEDELKRLDSNQVTLARALEEANAAREITIKIKGEMIEELERFRAAMRNELRARKRKIDLHDVFLLLGLGVSGTGIAVAFHWAYSLIMVGCVFITLSLVTLFRSPVKE